MRTDRMANPIANKAYPVVLTQLANLGYKQGQDFTVGDSTAGIDTDATSTIKYANPTIGFKASADILKAGQIASWYGNQKYGGAATTTLPTLSKLSGKKVDYNNAQEVYNSLDPEKQKEVVKAIYKHEGGSGVLSTFENFNTKVDSSRAKGYSDTQILDNLGKISPDLKTKIDKTRALFGKDPMINNDGDILARLSQKYAGTVPGSSPRNQSTVITPDQKNVELAQKKGLEFVPGEGVQQPKPTGVMGWLNKNIVEPFKDFGKATDATVGRQMAGQQTLAETALQGASHSLDLAFNLGLNVIKGAGGALLKVDKGILDVVAPNQMNQLENKYNQVKKTLSNDPIVQQGLNFLKTSLVKYDDWAIKNPRAADDISSAFTLGTSFIGGKEGAKALEMGGKEILAKGAVSDTLKSSISKDFVKAVKPSVSSVRYAGGAEKYAAKSTEALTDIVANTDKLNIVDKATGEAVPQISKMENAIDGTVQGVENGKKLIFSAYDNLQKAAGEVAGVDLKPIATELKIFANSSNVIKNEYPEVYKAFIEQANNLEKAGRYSLEEAQTSIQKANEILQNFYHTGSGGADSQAKAFASSRLRTALDDIISGETGQSYQALKTKYGNFKAIEKDVMNMALREAKKAPKGLYDVFGDMAASGEMLRGLVTLNPGSVASSFGIKSVQTFYKNLNSPNAILKKVFKSLEKEVSSEGENIITQALGAKPKGALQLPAPEEGAAKIRIDTPMEMPAKAPSTLEKEQVLKFGQTPNMKEPLKIESPKGNPSVYPQPLVTPLPESQMKPKIIEGSLNIGKGENLSQRIVDLTKKNGGVTINLKGDIPTKGYVYAPSKLTETKIPADKFSVSDVNNFKQKYYKELSEPGNHFGAWLEDGNIVLDVSRVEEDVSKAVKGAGTSDQDGVFNLSDFTTTYKKDYEKYHSPNIFGGENSRANIGGADKTTQGEGIPQGEEGIGEKIVNKNNQKTTK